MDKFDLTQSRLNSPAHATSSLLKGVMLLSKPGLRRFVWAPILVNLVVYGVGFWLAVQGIGVFIEWAIPAWLDWLRWLLWPLLAVSFLLVMVFTFTLVANLIAAPFYGLFAERLVEKVLGIPTGESAGTSQIKSTIVGSLSEIKRLRYYLVRAVPLLLLFIVPGINLFAPILWILFSAWFLALEFTAFPLEQDDVLFPDQLARLKGNRLGLVTFGGLVMFCLAIPVFNIFVPPAAIAGATVYLAGNRSASES